MGGGAGAGASAGEDGAAPANVDPRTLYGAGAGAGVNSVNASTIRRPMQHTPLIAFGGSGRRLDSVGVGGEGGASVLSENDDTSEGDIHVTTTPGGGGVG